MKEELNQLTWSSYDEVRAGFLLMIAPLRAKFAGRGHLKIGSHGAIYDEEISEMETFSRLIWGIAPFLSQNDDTQLQEEICAGISAGCNPESPNYWGELSDYNQKFVEMVSIALTFLLIPEKTWCKFSENEQKNIAKWLYQINQHKIPKNNWRFFRLLVNLALQKCGQNYSQEKMIEDFSLIEFCYAGEGWYFDGKAEQVDYYVSWAYHFYGLILAKFLDNEQAKIFKERAVKFAQSYRYWFAADGTAIPFGRSLTYRFAQSAFWSALVFANVEALPWGEIKGLFVRNMQYWSQQSIFSTADFLTVGYAYENLNMAEEYNAPGSPYWAFKSFLLLAVSKDHPFWSAEILSLNLPEKQIASEKMRALIEHTDHSKQIFYYPAGQKIANQHQAAAKYNKFVYSTNFGFSVAKDNYDYPEGAYDNMLALCDATDQNHYFRVKPQDDAFTIQKNQVIHYWQPFPDVKIKTTIIPCGQAHVRIHEIITARELITYDAGFSASLPQVSEKITDLSASISTIIGTTLIQGILGFEQAKVIRPEVNTNLLYSRTILPFLKTRLNKGQHTLISLVAGIAKGKKSVLPQLQLLENQLLIKKNDGTKLKIKLRNEDNENESGKK